MKARSGCWESKQNQFFLSKTVSPKILRGAVELKITGDNFLGLEKERASGTGGASQSSDQCMMPNPHITQTSAITDECLQS